MTSPKHLKQKHREEAKQTVLRKLESIGQPMNLLEIGFTATAQLVRNLAASGLVRVTVEITPRGKERLLVDRMNKICKKAREARLNRGAG